MNNLACLNHSCSGSSSFHQLKRFNAVFFFLGVVVLRSIQTVSVAPEAANGTGPNLILILSYINYVVVLMGFSLLFVTTIRGFNEFRCILSLYD